MRRRLGAHAEPARVAVLRSFFKTGPGEYGEGDVFIGVRVPALREVCRECRGVALSEVRSLLRSRVHEERALALLLLVDTFTRGAEAERKQILRLLPCAYSVHQQLGSGRLFGGGHRRWLVESRESLDPAHIGQIAFHLGTPHCDCGDPSLHSAR